MVPKHKEGERVTPDRLDPQTSLVDIQHLGIPSAIGTGVLEYSNGIALIDPGPTTCLAALEQGLATLGFALSDVRAVLLTHIHLDHATATGTIVNRVPEACVYVHPRGAIHMIDPTRLLASAGRIYGDQMETLWGEFLPVPAKAVVEVDEGDVVQLGERKLKVAYTPGHAKHHVAYYERATGTAWVGDVGGIRIREGLPIPVTPPPDIDVEVWNHSIDRVLAWEPKCIVPTHFGPSADPNSHFAELRRGLTLWADKVRSSLSDDLTEPDNTVDQARARDFGAWAVADLRERLPSKAVETYVAAFGGADDSWWGLARYWRKKTS